jgi:6-pyruvoyltetrahydropterin/6-carboxytetrahydropterin synthase
MKYQVVKTFTPEQGWSTAFRQWRAESHCRFIHGYAISVELTFEASTLDSRNWVIDFGSFKKIKDDLARLFDHKTVVAADDPHLETFKRLDEDGIIDLEIIPNVGCEAFSEFIAYMVDNWLRVEQPVTNDVRLVCVEVREHGSNAARYYP